MSISLDQTKKDIVTIAKEFSDRWGYPPTTHDLRVSVSSIKHNKDLKKNNDFMNYCWKSQLEYLNDIGLIRLVKGKRSVYSVEVMPGAIESLMSYDGVDPN